ncbi:MAG: alkaline phosphatase [Opitutales bacterium]
MSRNPSLSRRRFIKQAGTAGAASFLAGPAIHAGSSKKTGNGSGASDRAKNIIFLVVDGMGTGTLSLAHHWSLLRRKRPLNWMRLYERRDSVRALQDTASANSPVTDSAAAGSAWGCGQRVNNGTLNMSVAGETLPTIYDVAKAAGRATGLVTTCRITHATPAAFAANVADRDDEATIARQYLEREVDVLLGGGERYFLSEPRGDAKGSHDLEAYRAGGYDVVRNREELAGAGGDGPLLGLFAASHLPYALDRENNPELAGVPGLKEMFGAALKRLERADNGFVLQVEGGRVDHAAHANDAAATLREQLEFDDCIALASEYAEQHPDTLLVVTTDHGTGGCQLNGWGRDYLKSGPNLERLERFNDSFEALEHQFRSAGAFNRKDFEKSTGLAASDSQAAEIESALAEGTKYLSSVMTAAFAEDLLERTAVAWTSNNHTGECVELFAAGPGAGRAPAFMKNHELFGVMSEALA